MQFNVLLPNKILPFLFLSALVSFSPGCDDEEDYSSSLRCAEVLRSTFYDILSSEAGTGHF